ncbi:MAG: lysophospholipid acyltransferase family protein [Alphaproteobacteria bacterium]
MKSLKYFIEYIFVRIFYITFRTLGFNISSFITGKIFRIFGFFSKRTPVAINNIGKVIKGIKDKERKQIIFRMWENFGRVIGEYPNLDKIRVINNERIKIINIKNLLNPLKNNKNCLFFSAHIGNWELTSHALTENGFNINFIYRAPNNKYVDDLLRRIRINYGVGLIKKGPEGARECIKVLSKNGGNIGMLIDQKMNDGILTKFFNKDVMTASAIAKFALKYKCPIIPAFCIREYGTNFRIEYLEPITYSKIKSLSSEEKIMNYLNKIVEKWIKKYPDQWIWIHNRW